MADDDLYTRYAVGFVKSVKLESCSLDSQVQQVHEQNLVVYAVIKNVIYSETTGWSWTEQARNPPNKRLRVKVPVHSLETPKQCKVWLKRRLQSAQLKVVASEIGNPENILKELIWNLREKWVSGEICTGVIEMDVITVTELRETHRRRVLEEWGESNAKLFKGVADEFSSSTSCAICLDVLDEKSVVLELPCPCRHVFHSECIMAWLRRKRKCPWCRCRVPIRCKYWLWLRKKKSHLSLDLLPQLTHFIFLRKILSDILLWVRTFYDRIFS